MNPSSIVDLSIQTRRVHARTDSGEAAGGWPAGSPPAAAGSPPPVGNTGGKLTILVDHFNGTFCSSHLEAVSQLLSAHLGDGEDLPYGFHTYQLSRRWQTGALLLWSPGRRECCLSLNGDTCEALGLRKLYGLWSAFKLLGVNGTRIDLTADDYARRFSMEDVHAATRAGNFTKFKIATPIQERGRIGGETHLRSDSVRFGRRGKDGGACTVIIYDKLLESKGERDCIRVEVTLQGDGAAAGFLVLTQFLDDTDTGFARFVQEVGQIIGGAIDFRERGTETHIDRMERLPWWESFVQALGQSRVSVFKPLAPLVRTVNASMKQYRKKLAFAKIVLQSKGQDLLDWIRQQIESAEEQLTPRDWKRVAAVGLDLDIGQLFGGAVTAA